MGTPITAIVIFCDERRHLERCLRALRWCDELIAIDMASGDGSRAVAERYADRVLGVERQPIAEPTRVAAARLAKHDWVLLVDPDEEIPSTLAEQMAAALVEQPDAGAFSLPMWFYFKGRRLTTTVWGTLTYKQRLIHRERCDLLPWCNRLTQIRPGFRDVRLPHDGDNHMRHYWSDSYLGLLRRHLTRYCHTEAKAIAATGQRFTLQWACAYVRLEIRKTFRDLDGWRDFPRGWLLSGVYALYVIAHTLLLTRYQHRVADGAPQNHPIPTLTEAPAASPARIAA